MLQFVPASCAASAGPLGTYATKNRKHLGFKHYKLNWWSPEAMFHHPAMLCSYFYTKKFPDYREHFEIPDDFTLIADSGGFQQLTQKARLEPIKILRWQENNADIGFILDLPPANPKTLDITTDFSYFKKCANITKRNADIALRNKTNDQLKLYFIIQGKILKELQYWIQNIDLTQYQGVAISPKPPNSPIQTALLSVFAKELKIKNLHILLSTGRTVMPITAYVSKYFENTTFDSSSYGIGVVLMKYDLPFTSGSIRFGASENHELKSLPCDCEVCKKISIADLRVTEPSVKTSLLSLHNLHNYIRRANFLNSIKDDDDIFKHYIKRYPKTLKAYKFLKLYEEQGLESAYDKFFGEPNFGEWFG